MTMISSSSSPNNRRNIYIAIAAVVALVALVVVLTFTVFIPQSVKSNGNKKEADLSASYANGAVYLSKCVVKTKQAADVATAQTAALDKVLKDAVAGRYGIGGNNMDKGKLFSAIVEAYPNVNGLSKTFDHVMTVIVGCQDDFGNYQSVVQDKVRDFNSWRTGSWLTRSYAADFPNENMYVRLPGVNLVGAAAYDKIQQPIVDATTSSTYKTGEQSLDDPFGSSSSK